MHKLHYFSQLFQLSCKIQVLFKFQVYSVALCGLFELQKALEEKKKITSLARKRKD